MSLDLHQYLGIYFKCEPQYRNVEITETEYIKCHETYNKYNYEGKYCKLCGGEVKTISKSQNIINDFWDEITDELEEEIIKLQMGNAPDFIYYYLNIEYPHYTNFIGNNDLIIDLTDTNISEIIQNFQKQHYNIIQFLDKYYGKENYKIKYGYLQYWY